MNDIDPFIVLDIDLDHIEKNDFSTFKMAKSGGPGCPPFELLSLF
jgi:hypothetical protein